MENEENLKEIGSKKRDNNEKVVPIHNWTVHERSIAHSTLADIFEISEYVKYIVIGSKLYVFHLGTTKVDLYTMNDITNHFNITLHMPVNIAQAVLIGTDIYCIPTEYYRISKINTLTDKITCCDYLFVMASINCTYKIYEDYMYIVGLEQDIFMFNIYNYNNNQRFSINKFQDKKYDVVPKELIIVDENIFGLFDVTYELGTITCLYKLNKYIESFKATNNFKYYWENYTDKNINNEYVDILKVIPYKNKLFIFPKFKCFVLGHKYFTNNLYIYDIDKNTCLKSEIDVPIDSDIDNQHCQFNTPIDGFFSNIILIEDHIYCLPMKCNCLVKINVNTYEKTYTTTYKSVDTSVTLHLDRYIYISSIANESEFILQRYNINDNYIEVIYSYDCKYMIPKRLISFINDGNVFIHYHNKLLMINTKTNEIIELFINFTDNDSKFIISFNNKICVLHSTGNNITSIESLLI